MVSSATDSPARAPLLEPHDGTSFFEAPSAAALTAPISKSAVETPAAATRMLDMVTSSACVTVQGRCRRPRARLEAGPRPHLVACLPAALTRPFYRMRTSDSVTTAPNTRRPATAA